MRTHHTFRIGLAMAAGMIVAGCANEVESPAASSSAVPIPSAVSSSAPAGTTTASAAPPSAAGPATTSPGQDPLPTVTLTEKPPKEPTDQQPNTGWVGGMITRGGKGPCYGLVADDGQRYALYSAAGLELAQGARVRVNLETTMLRIYCGPGTLMAMTQAEPIK